MHLFIFTIIGILCGTLPLKTKVPHTTYIVDLLITTLFCIFVDLVKCFSEIIGLNPPSVNSPKTERQLFVNFRKEFGLLIATICVFEIII